jgi:hypothetical protein
MTVSSSCSHHPKPKNTKNLRKVSIHRGKHPYQRARGTRKRPPRPQRTRTTLSKRRINRFSIAMYAKIYIIKRQLRLMVVNNYR